MCTVLVLFRYHGDARAAWHLVGNVLHEFYTVFSRYCKSATAIKRRLLWKHFREISSKFWINSFKFEIPKDEIFFKISSIFVGTEMYLSEVFSLVSIHSLVVDFQILSAEANGATSMYTYTR